MTTNKLLIVGLSILVLVVGGLAAQGFSTASQVQDVTHRLALSVHSQLANRAKNVRTWCTAINADRDINRAFVVKHFKKNTAYPLQDLNCAQLAYATTKSAR